MLFQELNKLKRSSVITSVILMALGLAMVICPARYVDSLIAAMGYLMLIVAGVMVLDYLESKKALFNTIFLFLAIALGILGLSVLVFNEYVLKIIGGIFGVVLIFQGIEMFYNAVMYVRPSGRKAWWFLAFLALVLLAMGVLIFLNPFWDTPKVLLMVIGVALLFDALITMLRTIWTWPIKAE